MGFSCVSVSSVSRSLWFLDREPALGPPGQAEDEPGLHSALAGAGGAAGEFLGGRGLRYSGCLLNVSRLPGLWFSDLRLESSGFAEIFVCICHSFEVAGFSSAQFGVNEALKAPDHVVLGGL